MGHDGGSSPGEYGQTLDATDVATGWSEQVAVPHKEQCHVFEALRQVPWRLPFALRGLDSVNGSECIHDPLPRYCSEEGITFTRSRAHRQNDNGSVEQMHRDILKYQAVLGRHAAPVATSGRPRSNSDNHPWKQPFRIEEARRGTVLRMHPYRGATPSASLRSPTFRYIFS